MSEMSIEDLAFSKDEQQQLKDAFEKLFELDYYARLEFLERSGPPWEEISNAEQEAHRNQSRQTRTITFDDI